MYTAKEGLLELTISATSHSRLSRFMLFIDITPCMTIILYLPTIARLILLLELLSFLLFQTQLDKYIITFFFFFFSF